MREEKVIEYLLNLEWTESGSSNSNLQEELLNSDYDKCSIYIGNPFILVMRKLGIYSKHYIYPNNGGDKEIFDYLESVDSIDITYYIKLLKRNCNISKL